MTVRSSLEDSEMVPRSRHKLVKYHDHRIIAYLTTNGIGIVCTTVAPHFDIGKYIE